MARPRKPTNILKLAGAFKKDPQRLKARANEPIPSGPIGDAPDWMLPAEAACWRAIIAEAPAGVLTSADRGALGMMAQLRSLVETHSADSKSMALLLRCYTELGMTPASRSKVSVKTQKEEENEFAAV